jgi:hypothetical protein
MASYKPPLIGPCGFPANLHVLLVAAIAFNIRRVFGVEGVDTLALAVFAVVNSAIFAVPLVVLGASTRVTNKVYLVATCVWTAVFFLSWFYNFSSAGDCP